MSYHSLLRRQLRKHLDGDVPPEFLAFVDAVQLAYEQADSDRLMLERSLELSSRELTGANAELRSSLLMAQDSEERYREMFESATDMLYVSDLDGTLIHVNRAAEEISGFPRESLIGRNIVEFIPEEERPLALQLQASVLAGETPQAPELNVIGRDGEPILLEVTLRPIRERGVAVRIQGTGRDIRQRKRAEAVFRQTQKLESLGLLAGEIAHDFNNLLTTILGTADMLKNDPEIPLSCREDIDLIERASRSAADLTGRMLAFARGGTARFQPVDLRVPIADAVHLTRGKARRTLRVSVDVPPHPVMVAGDARQLQQALMNLILNAVDACDATGTLKIELQQRASQALLQVADNGSGMSEQVAMRIFEPFFTTKPEGAGTGLGLATAYQIVHGHQGEIAVDSRPGEGTTFTISLPIDCPAETTPSVAHATPSEDTLPGDRILVVDDDEMVRRTTLAILRGLGFRPDEAATGERAVELLRSGTDYACMVLDMVMPGMSGRDVFVAAQQLRPSLPVLVCTGFAPEDHLDPAMKRAIAGLVEKPFTTQELRAALDRIPALRLPAAVA